MSTADSSEAVAREQWRQVHGHPFYDVSNHGRVRSWSMPGRGMSKRKHPKILRLKIEADGYCRVKLSGRINARVHRLVAAAFLGRIPSKMQVNHKDGDKLNNRIENLEYVTPSQNVKHSWDTGLTPSNAGGKNPMARLTQGDVDIIRLLLLEGFTCKDIAASYGVHTNTIGDIKHGRKWVNS